MFGLNISKAQMLLVIFRFGKKGGTSQHFWLAEKQNKLIKIIDLNEESCRTTRVGLENS